MIKRLRKPNGCKLPAPPLGCGGYENLNSNRCLLAALVVMLGIIQGCATVPASVAAPIPPANAVGHTALAAGRKTYVSLLKCAMCHRPKRVSDYSVETWTEDILPKMSKKARLSPQEYSDVLAYIKATTTQK